MKTYEHKFKCTSCGKDQTIKIEVFDVTAQELESGKISLKEATCPGTFEREVFISGLCYDCQEKVFNRPAPGHEELWGNRIGGCPQCGCSIYQKDIDAGKCPTCSYEIDEEAVQEDD